MVELSEFSFPKMGVSVNPYRLGPIENNQYISLHLYLALTSYLCNSLGNSCWNY